jgi:cytochrome c553
VGQRALNSSALLAAVCWLGVNGSANADDARIKAFGQHLSGECTSCHRIDGVDNGVPSITGWPPADFVASSLDDQQLAALATYFATLAPPPKKK